METEGEMRRQEDADESVEVAEAVVLGRVGSEEADLGGDDGVLGRAAGGRGNGDDDGKGLQTMMGADGDTNLGKGR